MTYTLIVHPKEVRRHESHCASHATVIPVAILTWHPNAPQKTLVFDLWVSKVLLGKNVLPDAISDAPQIPTCPPGTM